MPLWVRNLMKCSRRRWNRSSNKNLTSDLSGFYVNWAYSNAWMSAFRLSFRQPGFAAAVQRSLAFLHRKAKGYNCVEVMGQFSGTLPIHRGGILGPSRSFQASSQVDV